MGENRLQREMQNRQNTERPKQWQQPELLPEPDKEPGFAYRWIRVSTLNMSDPRNLSAKLREGWEPVKLADHPEMHLFVDANSKFKDSVEIGGLLLCKMPEEFVQQRNAHYQKATNAQAEAVDNSFMKENDARMPLFKDKKTTTSFGKG